MNSRSLTGCLDDFLRRGEECAYVQRRGYRADRWSYRRVAESSFQFARELEERGIGKGERVLLWGPNSAEWVVAFFGCALRGAIVVPIDDVSAPDFAARVQQEAGAKLAVCSRDHAQMTVPVILFEELPNFLARHSSATYSAVDLELQDTLEIVFTSGTTAEPKGVVISHGNVLANMGPLETEIRKYLKYEKYVHPVRFLNLLPLSHVFGQFLGIFLPQLMGGTVIFQESLTPAEVTRTIRRERVSVLVAVPRMLQSLKEKVERDLEQDGSLEDFRQRFRTSEGRHFLRRWWIFRRVRRMFGWKFWAFICGGAALDSVTEDFWQRLGYAAVQGYGLTETTSIVSVNHPFRLGRGSIGKVLPGREVKLASDGEILVRGGGVTSGYWNREAQPVAEDSEGWYRTGDIGELDTSGNLYFKGRKKDVIVTPAGMNIYPEDLERALRAQPQVRDCTVIALPRNGNAEPCAVLIPRDRGEAAQEIVRRANESLAEYQRMHKWFVWPDEDFPRTSTQKPRANLILGVVQAKLLAKPGTTPDAASPSSPLFDLITRVTGRTPGALAEKANLEADLGLSSLDRVELLGALEDRYQVDLSETRFSAISTVGDLQRLLQGQASERAAYHYPRWAQQWPVTWIRRVTDYLLLLPAVYILGWPRIEGRENLRGVRGPVLVICNHVGDVDGGFVKAALPARLRHKLTVATGGEALEILRTPPASRNLLLRLYDRALWVLGVSLLNLFPLPREAGFRESFAFAGETTDRGYSVLLFPEGRHTEDGTMRPFRVGIGLLANNLRIPVVPMRIDGLFELKRAGKKFAWPYAISIKIGVPVQFEPGHDPQWIARELLKRVESL